MRRDWLAVITACVLLGPSDSRLIGADPGISLVGTGFVPGNATDLSGLAGRHTCQRDSASVCIDHGTLGGFGSAIAYTGSDNVFVAVAGRGPFDGRTDTPYLDRLHVLRMTVDAGAPFPNVQPTQPATRSVKVAGNDNLVGSAYAFNGANAEKSRRFDPEGVAIGRDGTIFVSDKYGPSILAFDRQGQLASRVAVPEKFLLAPPPFGHPSGDVDGNGNALELYPALNVFPRQANRGMERP